MEYISATGVYYDRARYDPATGRFVGQDPTSFSADDFNLYMYVDNNPTDLIDPNGMSPQVPQVVPNPPVEGEMDGQGGVSLKAAQPTQAEPQGSAGGNGGEQKTNPNQGPPKIKGIGGQPLTPPAVRGPLTKAPNGASPYVRFPGKYLIPNAKDRKGRGTIIYPDLPPDQLGAPIAPTNQRKSNPPGWVNTRLPLPIVVPGPLGPGIILLIPVVRQAPRLPLPL